MGRGSATGATTIDSRPVTLRGGCCWASTLADAERSLAGLDGADWPESCADETLRFPRAPWRGE